MKRGSYDAIVLGAGAAGLMFAREASMRGLSVLLVDHRREFAQKLLASGGGRCNFTNLRMEPARFISENPHFVKSALARYSPADFIGLLDEGRIGYREEADGQMFLRGSSRRIIDLLAGGAREGGAKIATGKLAKISRGGRFLVEGNFGSAESDRLVVATGGLSYPKLGASDLGHRIARQFGHGVVACRPGLVPFVLAPRERRIFSKLSGISFRARVRSGREAVEGDCLITHRGLSGPAMLRISSIWEEGGEISMDFFPGEDLASILESKRSSGSRMLLKGFLAGHVPDRLAAALGELVAPPEPIVSFSKREIAAIARALHCLRIVPEGTEGFARAEVTLGGVDTSAISSKTMESKLCPGLYFIGEVLDVAGDLGGYNLHWAWASARAAAQALSAG